MEFYSFVLEFSWRLVLEIIFTEDFQEHSTLNSFFHEYELSQILLYFLNNFYLLSFSQNVEVPMVKMILLTAWSVLERVERIRARLTWHERNLQMEVSWSLIIFRAILVVHWSAATNCAESFPGASAAPGPTILEFIPKSLTLPIGSSKTRSEILPNMQ